MKNFVLVGVVPVLGALTLGWVFVRSAIDYWSPDNSYTPAWFAFGGFKGVGPALVIGIGMLLLGVPLMFAVAPQEPRVLRHEARGGRVDDGAASRRAPRDRRSGGGRGGPGAGGAEDARSRRLER